MLSLKLMVSNREDIFILTGECRWYKDTSFNFLIFLSQNITQMFMVEHVQKRMMTLSKKLKREKFLLFFSKECPNHSAVEL